MSKKRASGAWVSDNPRIYNTATDAITTLPAEIISDGQPISAIINGNMTQSGTPTPSNIIYPSECGDLETTGTYAGQYKIPISSANTTTPVYLGEVQTTRKIKKLVLTGEENWRKDSDVGQSARYYITISDIENNTQNLLSSHFTQSSGYEIGTMNVCRAIGVFSVDKTRYPTTSDFKTYLQQQYAAGTPVCVWYVLATETTGIFNEPIRKIGDYSDSVSVANIPTTAGSQMFDVDTTLKPSEVALSYHGWHPIDNIHEHNNGEWN